MELKDSQRKKLHAMGNRKKQGVFDFKLVDRNIGYAINGAVEKNETGWLDNKVSDKTFDENHKFFKKLGYKTATRKELME